MAFKILKTAGPVGEAIYYFHSKHVGPSEMTPRWVGDWKSIASAGSASWGLSHFYKYTRSYLKPNIGFFCSWANQLSESLLWSLSPSNKSARRNALRWLTPQQDFHSPHYLAHLISQAVNKQRRARSLDWTRSAGRVSGNLAEPGALDRDEIERGGRYGDGDRKIERLVWYPWKEAVGQGQLDASGCVMGRTEGRTDIRIIGSAPEDLETEWFLCTKGRNGREWSMHFKATGCFGSQLEMD